MNIYAYNGKCMTVKELAEMSGIPPHTLRDRFRRGYSVEQAIKPLPTHDSVQEFCDSSWYRDWIGMSTNELHSLYWTWCISTGYEPVGIKSFSRQIFKIYPNLKTVPSKKGHGKAGMHRVIRER